MEPGDVISHTAMCAEEGKNLQAGMHFRISPDHSVLLMSTRPGAPYSDEVLEDGRVLIYEGHDEPRRKDGPDPKTVDQPLTTPSGTVTQNGRFYRAAEAARNGELPAERIRVYEKIRSGIWVFNGLFRLVDAWFAESGGRRVCKFRLEAMDEAVDAPSAGAEILHTRVIPSGSKRAVWSRDGGRCQECGATDNLHFDHIIPFSRGGSSLVVENIQLLCARHNLQKHDRIE